MRIYLNYMNEDKPPKDDMLTVSPPGFPPWGSIRSVGSPVFDDVQSSPVAPVNTRPFVSSTFSPGTDGYENQSSDGPVDIFGTSPGRSKAIGHSRAALSSRTNMPARVALPCPKLQQETVKSKSLDEKLDNTSIFCPRCRRIISLTDHPLECNTPTRVQDAEDLDLENRIRSALCRRSRRRKPSPQYNSMIHKSVRFDPAIISLGPEKRDVKSKSAVERSPALHSEATIRDHTAIKDEKGVSKLIESIKTILALEKHDRGKLQILLDALNIIENNVSKVHAISTTEKSLNPHAPEFCSSLRSPTREIRDSVTTGSCTLPATPTPKRASLPPAWMNYAADPIDCIGPAAQESRQAWTSNHNPKIDLLTQPIYQQERLPIWVQNPQTAPHFLDLPVFHAAPMIQALQPARSIECKTSTHLLDEPLVDSVPVIFQPPPGRKSIPIIDPSPNTDCGHGREAKAVDTRLGKNILEKFAAKYPLTGKLKAAPAADSKGRFAAAIQQRLEYLLMQEREKKALRPCTGKENVRATNDQAEKSVLA